MVSQSKLVDLKNATYEKMLELRTDEHEREELFVFGYTDIEADKLRHFLKLMMLRKPANAFATWKSNVFDKPVTDPRLLYLLKADQEKKKQRFVGN